MSARDATSPLADAEARDAIRHALDDTLVVEAAAGTGKTTALVGRILALVMSGKARLESLVAVTFTEKAAGEMKLRLRSEIERARTEAAATRDERARLDAALAELEAAQIGTIHGFCADLLRERPIEACVDPSFDMAGEEAQAKLYGEAFDAWFQAELASPREGVERVLRRRPASRDDSGPRDLLKRAGRSLIEARDFPAGWSRPPFERAAEIDELVRELRVLGAMASNAQNPDDYLAQNLAEIRRFTDELERRESIRARDYDGLEVELRRLARPRFKTKNMWNWTGGRRPLYGPGLPRADVIARRDRAKARLDEVLVRCEADLAAALREELRTLVVAYEELKAKAGKLDFLDLLLRTRDLLKDNDDVRRELQGRFSHLLVDEFQDTDPLQAEILLLLAADDPHETDASRIRIVSGKLFVVGDPKQSIYRFRRADVALYERIKRDLLNQGARLVHLTTSFRSAPAIQKFVNEAFTALMVGNAEGSQAEYVALQPFRADNPDQPAVVALPVPRPYTDFGKVASYQVEASIPDAVGAFIEFLVKKSGFLVVDRERNTKTPILARHVCVLFKQLQNFGEDKTRAYVRALEVRGIPHVLMGGRSYHAREEVLAVRNAFSAIEWPDDELSVFATLRGPLFALPDDALLAYRHACGSIHPLRTQPTLEGGAREVAEALAVLARLHRGRNRRPLAETLTQLLAATRAHAGIASWPTGEQALANLLRVSDLARRFEAQGTTSFRAFATYLEEEAERGGAAEAPVVEEGTDGVRLMTVHKAKGLEFPVVILADPTTPAAHEKPSRWVDPSRGLSAFPLAGCAPAELVLHAREVQKRDEEETVRLAYVATTRARDMLVVPAVGDEPVAGWLQGLNPVLYPDPALRRRPGMAPGCPNFGDDSVVERPPSVERSKRDAVAPGLHRSPGGSEVVWFDPLALDLDKSHEMGLRQRKLFEADEKGTRSADGERSHADWTATRTRLIERGRTPSLRLVTATELAAADDEARAVLSRHAVASQEVKVERVDRTRMERPGGARFGTLVHAVLAAAPLAGDRDVITRVVDQHARLVGATPQEALAAVEVVLGALAHPLFVRARASDARGDCRREVPVILRSDEKEDVVLEGVVDLAFLEDDSWMVVDYKTDRELDAGLERYLAQVSMYVAAIARATGRPARGALLHV